MMDTSFRHLLRRLGVLALAALLAGCASRATAPAPAIPMPADYDETPVPGAVAPAADWWRAFGSPALSEQVVAALAANADIGIANERVMEAQAQAQVAGASLLPALSFGLGGSRRGGEGNDAQGSVNASLGASYELDLWGRNGAAARAARLAVRASEADRAAVRLGIAGAVVTANVELLALQARLAVADENIDIAQQVLRVVESRHRNGAASKLDLARQRNAVFNQQAALLPLQLQQRQLLAGLAILLDQAPQGFANPAFALQGLVVPQVAAGLPASLLLRRPDLLAAEAQLAAAHASVAAARAALLPSISLTGSAGAASSSLAGLLRSPAWSYALGAQLLQSIFDGGRQRAQVDGAAARERALVLGYRKAVLAALADVESALAACTRLAVQEQLQMQGVEQAALALQLAQVRYRAGTDDLIVLLDAQRSLFQAQDALAQLRRGRLLAALALFKALGGGGGA